MSFETEYQNWLGQENLELYLREQLEKKKMPFIVI